MKKSIPILMAITVFLALFATACGGSAPPPTQAIPPTAEVLPTQPPPVIPPTQQPPPPQQEFAPACQVTACTAPAVTNKAPEETYCVKKIPYVNVMAPAGTIFQPVPKSGDPAPLVCTDSGTVVNGLTVFSCRGAELWSYELKVTNPACGGGSNLQANSPQCQPGLGYDAANNCCAPITANDAGSVTITVDMGACPSE